MPMYEYECESCGHRFEVIQKFSDARKRTCPKCKGKLKRLISAPGLHFKGSGWYITDYGRGGSSPSQSSESSDGSGTKESKPAEPKPAAPAAPEPRRARRTPARRKRR